MSTSTSAMTAVHIPCCLCGVPILPNSANQCNACLAQEFDLKSLLQKGHDRIPIHQCRQCRKFARTDTVFERCGPESPQLLSICLKHIPAFVQTKSSTAKLQIIDAIWVWTEPNSMRLKVRVTVRTELENVQLQQRIMVEFEVRWKQCPDCNREFTSRTWSAIVQLRQKREQGAPRKGLAALEMALRRNTEIRKNVLHIDSCRHGLDFYFLGLAQAQSFASFLQRLAPMRVKTTSKLVSTDNHSNTANIKYTLAADMVPLCRDDLILVGKGSRSKLAGRLGLVLRVTSNISIVDASPKRIAAMDTMDLPADSYYKTGGDKTFPILQTAERMIRWVVLDIEPCGPNEATGALYEGPPSGVDKFSMANALVARESDMGQNDSTYSCVTHLGNLIQPGDIVLGYDLESTLASLSLSTSEGVVDLEEVVNSNVVMPDVVLVKKVSSGNAEDEKTADDDEPVREGKKRVSKKKLRRRKKQDKKQRELEETAARMGFLEDPEGISDGHDDEDHGPMDEDLVADLEAVEKELATYQEEQEQQKQEDATTETEPLPIPSVTETDDDDDNVDGPST
jgi:nonsense-mediated mRNA decay protein 3